ncbi:hypothetical protein PGTUg99_007859 [Puccinia graminis f. sp. tritici]|uniref:RING-type domain-containing protein n=1 Tax=Puccinia graminis f. sp. tritici TaxID=56615 RepID=A0A5B0N1M5_PUCGR|nr:hypothetical protein PGTUg99_007859 [Puccinia graminis f. sp. tritici]
MHIRISAILLLILGVFFCYVSNSCLAQLSKRDFLHQAVPEGRDLEESFQESEAEEQTFEGEYQNSQVVPVQGDQIIREYPRREVNWDKFPMIKYSHQTNSFVRADKTEYLGEVSLKGNVKESTWARKKLRAMQESTKRSILSMNMMKKFWSRDIHFKNPPEECVICLGEFNCDKPETLLCVFPGCDHVFHKDCLAEWFKKSPDIESLVKHSLTCPTCRKDAPTKHGLRFLGAAFTHHGALLTNHGTQLTNRFLHVLSNSDTDQIVRFIAQMTSTIMLIILSFKLIIGTCSYC